ncbi:EpsG family protein [Pseudooceanicola aestuarii]|uniref:EpsG family protein n=1 Tax=Pseudooceanicola aestuarii TaxID=2697319 RepID=UPI0013D874B1|nr:EpsG family protein [Pseudooceanicola aestuarii]
MTYLLATYGLFLLPFQLGRRALVKRQVYGVTLLLIFVFSAFRFEVGCDWSGYYFQYLKADRPSLQLALEGGEPLWWSILYLMNTQNIPYPVANVISSAIFFVGVHLLARRQPNPLAFLVLLFPILIINMPMSAIRQGAGVGLLCVALAAFIDRKPVWCAVWIVLASGFHSSAAVFLILLPLATGNYARSRIMLAAVLAIPGVLLLSGGDAAEIAVDRYVGTGVDAAGAAFRVGVLVLSGLFFFLFLRRPWRRQFPSDFALAHLFSMAMVLLIALVPVSSVIGDRLGYFLIPVQAMIFARVPFLDIPNRKLMTLLPYIGLALMFTVWTSVSYHFQQCYLPYNSWLFGFPNSLWSGL